MMRNLKVLGIAAFAAFALTAISASAAFAAAPEFHGEKAPVEFTGSQVEQHVFTVSGGTVKCSTATFSGTNSTTTSTTATLSASYSGCKLFGLFSATVNMNGCVYIFHLVAGSSPPTATVDISCPAGKVIEITSAATTCKVTVGGQNGLKHVTFANTGTGTSRDIDATINVSGITYTESAGCPAPGTRSNGTYTGTATIQGVGQGVWVE